MRKNKIMAAAAILLAAVFCFSACTQKQNREERETKSRVLTYDDEYMSALANKDDEYEGEDESEYNDFEDTVTRTESVVSKAESHSEKAESSKASTKTSSNTSSSASSKAESKKENTSNSVNSQPKKDVANGTISNFVNNGQSMQSGVVDFPSSAGALSVEGMHLVDSSGRIVQLKGVSTHGLSWYPEYVNSECFSQLRNDWGVNVIRLAMYSDEYNGYCSGGNQDELKNLVRAGVQYATENDMYVIIDWHILSDGNPNTHIDDARAFFEEMSASFKDNNNVIYEICNEPNGGVSWSEIKSYAEDIIKTIRANDKDGVILVGTPNWSQQVADAAADPIKGYDNIMYTLHFYAGTHTSSLRGEMIKAMDSGLPIFVSEYGICDASGNGSINAAEADRWVQAMDNYGISYVAWNLSNKDESASIIKADCDKTANFELDDLSESGRWLYETLTNTVIIGGENPAPVESTPSNNDTTSVYRKNVANYGVLEYTIELEESWEQNGEFYQEYLVVIHNQTDEHFDGWNISINFNGGINLGDKWNGIYKVQGGELRISNKDYNGSIEPDGYVRNIGFIVHSDTELSPVF